MNISAVYKKGRFSYYGLYESVKDIDGNVHRIYKLYLGALSRLTREEIPVLARMVTAMVTTGETVLCENKVLHDTALGIYAKYIGKFGGGNTSQGLNQEISEFEGQNMTDIVTVRLNSLVQKEARTIGPENICHSTLKTLKLRSFLLQKGFSAQEADIAQMQIAARSIYPCSEYKTVKYLKGNSALPEIYNIDNDKITKDMLYQSALRLWDIHSDIEDYLHGTVRSMFKLEEKILLFDITNTYFEGRYTESDICQYGRNKEKRDDCKIVVLAAVVNTDGLVVRTKIYEGNKNDGKTLKEVIGSLTKNAFAARKQIVVIDAGFYTKENIKWLTDNGFDYITVLPAGDKKFRPSSGTVIEHEDSRHQCIRLQKGHVDIDGESHAALLVDSDAKALKEKSMYERACKRYEEGLALIKAGVDRKGGIKSRDAVNRRLGKLDKKYGSTRNSYTVELTYSGEGKKEKVASMAWSRNEEKSGEEMRFHGKYVLLTSLDANDEVSIWKFYNVIRTVEETFKVLKTDLDIRPVYHKSDDGIKAHLNLAVLAYWVVSVTKYRLKIKGYDNIRWSEIMRIASAQVAVTAQVETVKGQQIQIRQSTQAEESLQEIYTLLNLNPQPLGRKKSVVHKKPPLKKCNSDNQVVT